MSTIEAEGIIREGNTSNEPASAVEAVARAELNAAQSQAVAALRSPLDAALSKPNARPGSRAPSLWDADAPLLLPSPTLDPGNITSLPEYEALEGYGCTPAVEAMKGLHAAIKQVIDGREAIKTDPTLTEAAMVLAVDDLMSKVMEPATKRVDAAQAMLGKAIDAQEAALRAPIKEVASGQYAREVRDVVRALKPSERLGALTSAIASGDAVTVGALLGCPVPLLTGLELSDEARSALINQWNMKQQPQAAKRLALLKAAQAKLEAAGSTFIGSMARAVGAKHSTVAMLRAKRNNARTVLGAVVPLA